MNEELKRYTEGKQNAKEYRRLLGIPEPKPTTKRQKKALAEFKRGVKASPVGLIGNLIHKIVLTPSKPTATDKKLKEYKIAKKVAKVLTKNMDSFLKAN